MRPNFLKSITSLITIILFLGCNSSKSLGIGVTFIASRGSSPSVQSVVWSPTDEYNLLVVAYETPAEPAEVYMLDVRTGQQDVLAQQLPGYFFEAKWTPDGMHALILAENNTEGFEPSGWWLIDINDTSSAYFMPSSDIAWSPDGKKVAVLREEKMGANTKKIDLLLIDVATKTEKVITTYNEADSSWGLSWSPDGQYLVFSLGQTRSSNLYILNTKTLHVAQITDNDGSQHPAWSPRGNIIAYERNFPDNIAKTYLYLVSSEGKCEVEIPNLENVWSPTWSPDGNKLGYVGREGIYYLEIDKVLRWDVYQNLCE